MNTITFFFGVGAEDPFEVTEKNFLNAPHRLFSMDKYIDLPQDVLYENLKQIIQKIMDVFEKLPMENSEFEVNEVELGLNIGTDGKVSVVAIEGAASANTSIKIKLKRK